MTPAAPALEERQSDGHETPLARLADGYSDRPLPLGSYVAIAGLFNLSFALFLVVSKRANRPLPERLSAGDILLLGLATFKMSRLLSKDLVAAPLRAPFTRFEEIAGEGEVNEEPRGEGPQRAVGQLLTCPFCLGLWVASAFAYGLILSPPLTRFVASILTTKVISDFLHLAYCAAEKGTEGLGQKAEG